MLGGQCGVVEREVRPAAEVEGRELTSAPPPPTHTHTHMGPFTYGAIEGRGCGGCSGRARRKQQAIQAAGTQLPRPCTQFDCAAPRPPPDLCSATSKPTAAAAARQQPRPPTPPHRPPAHLHDGLRVGLARVELQLGIHPRLLHSRWGGSVGGGGGQSWHSPPTLPCNAPPTLPSFPHATPLPLRGH